MGGQQRDLSIRSFHFACEQEMISSIDLIHIAQCYFGLTIDLRQAAHHDTGVG